MMFERYRVLSGSAGLGGAIPVLTFYECINIGLQDVRKHSNIIKTVHFQDQKVKLL